MTIVMSIVGMICGSIVGLAVALLRLLSFRGPLKIIGWALTTYVEVLRGLPLIVTLFIVYFGLPAAGIRFADNPNAAAILAMTLHLGAYLSETFRAALLAVDSGQMEAARSMGMSSAVSYRRIIIPQAMLIAVPTLGSWFISLLKETSLLSFISVVELMRAAVVIVNQTFKPFAGYLTVGVIYLALSLTASFVVRKVESRLRAPGSSRSAAARRVVAG